MSLRKIPTAMASFAAAATVLTPITASVITASAASAAGTGDCFGTVQVTRNSDDTLIGTLGFRSDSSAGMYVAPPDATAQTLIISDPDANGIRSITTNAGETRSNLAGTSGSDNGGDPTLAAGSYHYVFLTNGSPVPRGPATTGSQSLGNDDNYQYETAIWTLNPDTSELGVNWVNPGGGTIDAEFIYYPYQQWVLATADPAAVDSFAGVSLPPVTLTLELGDGADCDQTPPDTTAPTVTITDGPADGATVKTAPTYEFSSTDTDVDHYECAIDDATYTTCTSPYDVDITDLDDGNHTFSVRAVDTSQNTGTAVSRDFTLDAVDTEAPDVTIIDGPADGASVETAPTYTFSSTADDVDHYECSLDGTTYTTCTSPYTPDVEPGTYTFSVKAVDTANNASTVASRTFTLRDIACENATTAFYDAKADVRDAKDKLAAARESGNPKRIERAKARLADAKSLKQQAKANVIAACGSVPPPQGSVLTIQ